MMTHGDDLKHLAARRMFWKSLWVVMLWIVLMGISLWVIANDHTGYVKESDITPCAVVTEAK